MKKIEGGICAVEGVKAAGACEDNYGVAVIHYPDSSAAAVFTKNKVQAAPIIITRESVKDGKLSVIVANSGNANCFTGKEGIEHAKLMASQVAEGVDVPLDHVAVASTGIIGRQLPLPIISKLITDALRRLENSSGASRNAAEAIMTTDTYPKEFAVETTLKNGKTICIGGITKGSGMIAPNMGTMLSFITTDIEASPAELEEALKKSVEKTFNMVVVDGDESTNDIVILMSRPGKGNIDGNFQEALDYLCSQLARMMAHDGEGATKYMEVEVKGAQALDDARMAAKSIVKSPLVKTALFGADPNWGRIVAAVGYSGARMDENTISVRLEEGDRIVDIVDKGKIMGFEGTEELELAESIMEREEIKIIVDLALGNYEATAYGCDLSYDYVRINSEYST
ncbi:MULTISPECIES: bifunctional ornithine acetyltransferase/N-acetylglutamate synthase [Methanobacterium]|jgi:glutamate N-acetyltransferase/amino-acid N-acetyltransferase|uniref:Glutamate N-acetyltransferase n=1 Tax=Methanobacterium subterraneum TaxID=59277 RepID=A0A2H4VP64_9EURY|nr:MULTISPECIES: bifunctional ornithine acetyltransferase/N-acetylglutamate synthase [Methanobacterium]MBW4257585.1 bifunctional ornithine acetyltransferase/N-acetylglutamate synthase [Methanobacterium sp. YSL]PKL71595.1 MAG: ornithine acetyltransferase [Methanobacteriales archaeon HGW-Methanobacteriales-2]AUB58894.1 bifunctional ornithine acetyltransferase/N-acetylglutamate synthase [Methanobacterium sp. MZ-A1]AUB59895.1 bifunctional ornithine acetyltransferase/N-acetylglutamate synthase [Meth